MNRILHVSEQIGREYAKWGRVSWTTLDHHIYMYIQMLSDDIIKKRRLFLPDIFNRRVMLPRLANATSSAWRWIPDGGAWLRFNTAPSRKSVIAIQIHLVRTELTIKFTKDDAQSENFEWPRNKFQKDTRNLYVHEFLSSISTKKRVNIFVVCARTKMMNVRREGNWNSSSYWYHVDACSIVDK